VPLSRPLTGAVDVDSSRGIRIARPARRHLAVLAALSWWPIITAAGLYVAVAAGGSMAAVLMQRFVIAERAGA
jgi:hypothetical protein